MKITLRNTKYTKGEHEILCVGYYVDGSKVIHVRFSDDPSDYMCVTTCLAGQNVTPAEGNVFIKNYSENEGILEDLIENKIVEVVTGAPGRFVTFPEVKLLVNLPAPGVDERGV